MRIITKRINVNNQYVVRKMNVSLKKKLFRRIYTQTDQRFQYQKKIIASTV